jgi:transposase
MAYKKGDSRKQTILFPQAIDDYISKENPVRFIDAFVEYLDLNELDFQRAEAAPTGRPPYDPRDLLKLYIYGYLNHVRSSRRLEKETHKNIEVMWLLRKVNPDHKTIADFRKDNLKSFKKVFREFNILCRKLDLFGNELMAIDGSKFKASNNKDKNITEKLLETKLREIDEKVENYFQKMDELDKEESDKPAMSFDELHEKISHLRDRKESYKKLSRKMKMSGETQISLTDPDSRTFPKKFGVDVGYNSQVAVDEKHHLIVEQDVTNAVTDIDQLSDIAIKAKEALSLDKVKVVADAGYCNAKEIQTCDENGIEAYTSRIPTSINKNKGLYTKDAFRYDKKRDCYFCPAGKKMTYRFQRTEKRRKKRREVLYYICYECRKCSLKHLCTKANARRITRCPEEHAVDLMNERVKKHPEIIKKRKQIVEHVFGSIKFWNGHDYFLMRGLEKVKAEFSLSALSYNVTRVINLVGIKRMIEALE